MSLREKQSEFVVMLSRLIDYATQEGYQLTIGDAYRDPRVHGVQGDRKQGAYGRKISAHKQRLAIDLNLFKDGVFLTTTEDHEPLGLFWEAIGGTWGGRFNDGNHYSVEQDGVK